jgi:hypothetical protein
MSGVIQSATPLMRLVAVDRSLADPLAVSKADPQDPFLYSAKVDAKTGAFTISGLLPGHTYDLIAWTKDTRWEGINMEYHRVVVPDQPATDDDKQWIKDFVSKELQFANKARVLWMAADHKHAVALVELIRDTGFHSGAAGEIIYRTELWYFENDFGGWAKDRNTEKVITRWRGQSEHFPANWQYVPLLGAITLDATGASEPVHVTLPEKPEKKHGIAGGL